MKYQEGYLTNQMNHSLYYQSWLPEGSPRAALMIIHGLNEHSGRYENFANRFVGKGFAVYGLDLYGHGKSEGTRSYVEDFSQFIEDHFLYLQKIKGWLPDCPVFLIGHSMGGLIGTLFLIDHPGQISGAVFSASSVQVPDYISSLTIKMGHIMSKIMPKLGIIQLDLSGLSRNPEVIQAYKDDPLVHSGKTTARISAEMNNAIDRVAAEAHQVNTPLLILHGGADYIVSPSDSTYLHQLVSSEQKELIIYKDFYHEIYNDFDHNLVFQDVTNWLDKQLK
jgi:alpha-beta hydrolase superfamily lysophospholipase